MSILDIIIISMGAVVIGLYAYFQITKTKKWKKKVRELVANGYDLDKAKILANQEFYKKKNKKAGKDKTPQEIEEEIFTE